MGRIVHRRRSNVVLNAINSKINMDLSGDDLTEDSGYGAYAIGSATENSTAQPLMYRPMQLFVPMEIMLSTSYHQKATSRP